MNDGQEFAGAGAKGGEAEDAIVGADEDLHEAAGLVEGAGAKGGGHGDLAEAIGCSLLLCFVLAETYVGQFGVGEGYGGDLAVLRGAVCAGQVVADDAEVVEGDVGEVGRTGAVSHGPDAGGGGFEAIVDLEVAGGSSFDAYDVEIHVLRVGRAASGDEDVGALELCAIA